MFKNQFNCRLLNSDKFSSFEMQLIKGGTVNTLLIALVYRQPKINRDFIPEFADFLSNTMPNFDHILILGNLNIHVCCPSKPLVSEIMHLIESFNLTQFTTGPTHKLGHTLDLVLSCGFPIFNMEIIDACLSDHSAVLLDSFLSFLPTNFHLPVCCSHYLNSSTADKFSLALIAAPNTCTIEASPSHLSTILHHLFFYFRLNCPP